MAHNLNQVNGKTSFFTVKEKAWHGLGQVLQECPNSEQAIKLAGLDYEVAMSPVLFKHPTDGDVKSEDTRIRQHDGRFVTYRTDTLDSFGVVGGRYHIVQNKDAFNFFDSIVGEGAAIYETAGCLNKGETVFITAKLPDYIRVGKEDLIEQYIFLKTSHDGQGAILAAFTPVRIVCNNTLNAALKNMSNQVYIKHTASAKAQLEAAHKIMGISHKMSDELNEVFNRMAQVKITDKKVLGLIQAALAPNPEALTSIIAGDEVSAQYKKNVDLCMEYAMSHETQQMDTTKGTVFGAYNAITGYFQNVNDWKNADSKLENIVDGRANQIGQKAFDLCLTMLK